jgi:hypothetical protein
MLIFNCTEAVVEGYLVPVEEMMVHWLRQYCELDEAGIQVARKRRNEVQQEIRDLKAAHARQEWPSQ